MDLTSLELANTDELDSKPYNEDSGSPCLIGGCSFCFGEGGEEVVAGEPHFDFEVCFPSLICSKLPIHGSLVGGIWGGSRGLGGAVFG